MELCPSKKVRCKHPATVRSHARRGAMNYAVRSIAHVASVLVIVGALISACGSEGRNRLDGKNNPDGSASGLCGACTPAGYNVCDAAGNSTPQQCAEGTVCVPQRGCLACLPGANTCVGNDIHACTNEG